MAEMVLQPPGRAPERLLMYGPQDSGKTTAIAKILARALAPGQTAYVLDTDNSWARVLESGNHPRLVVRAEWEGGQWEDEYTDPSGRIVLMHPRGWPEEQWCLEYAWAAAGRGDWVVLDSATHPWEHIASWYIETVHGADLPEFLIDARMRRKDAGKASDGGNSEMLVEWVYINKVWSKAFLTPYVNARCHVAVTAEAKPLRTDDKGDAKDVKDLYATVGMKPDSQRRLGANSQTVLLLEKARVAGGMQWIVSTVKDRERERLWRAEWTDMGMEYLKQIAGWKMTKMDHDEGEG